MSISSQPFHSAIDQCQRSETRSLATAKKLQASPNDSLAYCEFQTELRILMERLQQCQQALTVLHQQDQTLAKNIKHRLSHTQALIQELDQMDNIYLENPQNIKRPFYQRLLNNLTHSIQSARQQTLAFFAGTRKSIQPPVQYHRKKLTPLQIQQPRIRKANKIIVFPLAYRKPRPSISAQKQKNHKCQLIQLPIGEMNQPVNHNTPKP